MSINQRIATLRQWMAEQCGSQCGSNWAYVVPTADPHNNEYIPPHWMCREWLTAFKGSAGIAVVTATQAALWRSEERRVGEEGRSRWSPYH